MIWFFQRVVILEGSGILSDGMDSYPADKGGQLFVAASAPSIRVESDSSMHILGPESCCISTTA
jgi:mannose-6-phosphate isomerase class I